MSQFLANVSYCYPDCYPSKVHISTALNKEGSLCKQLALPILVFSSGLHLHSDALWIFLKTDFYFSLMVLIFHSEINVSLLAEPKVSPKPCEGHKQRCNRTGFITSLKSEYLRFLRYFCTSKTSNTNEKQKCSEKCLSYN